MVIVSAVSLPLQQIVFCMSWVVTSQYAESLNLSDVLALALVCAGYYVYQWLSVEGTSSALHSMAESASEGTPYVPVQEDCIADDTQEDLLKTYS